MRSAGATRTLAVLQPGYLPWLGFFDQMRRADVFVLYDDVQFDKHGWRNRNRIKAPGGPRWLTVPVRHAGLARPRILDMAIDNTAPWARKHVGSLRQYYARAPYLARYLPEIEELLHRPWELLVDLNLALSNRMAEWLGVRCAVVRSSRLEVGGERTDRLLNLCRHFGAGRYLSGDAARDYLDTEAFSCQGIEVVWQQYRHPTYDQQHGDFVPYLSAVDLLFNCGDRSAAILASGDPGAGANARSAIDHHGP